MSKSLKIAPTYYAMKWQDGEKCTTSIGSYKNLQKTIAQSGDYVLVHKEYYQRHYSEQNRPLQTITEFERTYRDDKFVVMDLRPLTNGAYLFDDAKCGTWKQCKKLFKNNPYAGVFHYVDFAIWSNRAKTKPI